MPRWSGGARHTWRARWPADGLAEGQSSGRARESDLISIARPIEAGEPIIIWRARVLILLPRHGWPRATGRPPGRLCPCRPSRGGGAPAAAAHVARRHFIAINDIVNIGVIVVGRAKAARVPATPAAALANCGQCVDYWRAPPTWRRARARPGPQSCRPSIRPGAKLIDGRPRARAPAPARPPARGAPIDHCARTSGRPTSASGRPATITRARPAPD